MLSIRLKPVGKRHQRSFRVVVAKKRSKRTGKFIEDLGWYNPHFDKFEVNKERVSYWLSVGAKPTDTVFNILVSAQVIAGPKKAVHKKSKKEQPEQSAEKTQETQTRSQPQEGDTKVQESAQVQENQESQEETSPQAQQENAQDQSNVQESEEKEVSGSEQTS